ncbi:hypothetical protein GCM10009092_45880 [Bowmanella denitrificans]|uniref:Uncharacterized protein n=1 Tax=Bowmanella denitrificans TaxID=366582 RepID=A0ABP3HQM8_9ALTE
MAVFVGARDLSGVPIGTHQFIVLTGQHLLEERTVGTISVKAKSLGGGTFGLVVGAHNRGHLAVKFFEEADHEAALEHFGGKKVKWYSSDFDAEFHTVDFGNTPEKVATDLVLFRINAFMINQSLDKIAYPTLGLGFNSNSWAQSVIAYSSGKVTGNFRGLDYAHARKIPRTYFEPVCTVKPRPRVN